MKRWSLVVVILALLVWLTYWGSAALFFYWSNRVIRVVLTDVRRNSTDLGQVHGIQQLCRFTGRDSDQEFIGTSWNCTPKSFLHPYSFTEAFTASSRSNTNELITVGVEMGISRLHWQPLSLTIIRDFRVPGTRVKVLFRPVSDKAASISAQRDAVLNVHLRYRCSLPFAGCETFEDFVEIR